MKKAAWYLVFTITLLLMMVAVFIYVAPHIGWRVNAVLSGSMEPELKVGSLVVSRPVEPETIEVGDIIVFRSISAGESLITHRVVGIGHHSPLYFETQGDANHTHDPFAVPAENVVGMICFHMPYIGYVTEFLKTPWGFLLGLVMPALIILAMYVRNIQQALSKRKIDEVASR